MTKKEIIQELDKLGVKADPKLKKEELLIILEESKLDSELDTTVADGLEDEYYWEDAALNPPDDSETTVPEIPKVKKFKATYWVVKRKFELGEFDTEKDALRALKKRGAHKYKIEEV